MPEPAPTTPTRRGFLRLLAGAPALAAAPALGATGCGGPESTPEERAALERRRRREQERSGEGPLGELRFEGYRGLAELPWLELDGQGRLALADAGVPAGIDLHTHLGMSMLFAPDVDLSARPERVRYMLDCDAEPGGCELDLDRYMNQNFSPEGLSDLRWNALRQLTVGSPWAATQTIPALAEELERLGFEHATALPIAFGLPFGDELSERWLAALDGSPHAGRVLPGCSVHPSDPEKRARLRRYVRQGARILKLHPEMQRFRPDAAEAMEVYEECERLGLPVIFHAGRSGIEPEWLRPYALVRHLEAPAAEFPELPMVLGHGGALDWPDAIPLAARHANLSLGIASLGASAILEMVRELGPERLTFGSDWPFYPVASALAKVLVVGRERPDAVAPVLRENSLRVLEWGAERRAAA